MKTDHKTKITQSRKYPCKHFRLLIRWSVEVLGYLILSVTTSTSGHCFLLSQTLCSFFGWTADRLSALCLEITLYKKMSAPPASWICTCYIHVRRKSPEVRFERCYHMCFYCHVELDLVRTNVNSWDYLEKYVLDSEIIVSHSLCIKKRNPNTQCIKKWTEKHFLNHRDTYLKWERICI